MSVVHGENTLVEILIDGEYYPVLCATDLNFRLQQEVVLKTGPNSGLFREKTTRLNEAFCRVMGLTPIDNGDVMSFFYILQESVRCVAQTIRITFEDAEGNDKQILGSALIVISEIDGNENDWSNCTIDFEFSGAVTISTVTAPPGVSGAIYSDVWNTVEGQTYVDGTSIEQVYTMEDMDILEVDREGTQYDLITSGTPSGRQCKYNSTDDRIEFDPSLPFNAGETVFILFRR